jgi:Transposase DDE domain group 1
VEDQGGESGGGCKARQFPSQKGISEINANSTRSVTVESGGTQVVGHVGLHALGMFADRLGVGSALSTAVGWNGPGIPVHDRGRVLTHTMLMLAGGGESCTDIETLASQERLFGDICSDTTLYRTFTETLDSDTVQRARRAMAQIRADMWNRTRAVTGGDTVVILDLDASLVEIHSENKQGAAPHFKGGYGFHPLFCFADATGEALARHLRAGNAAANDVTDLLRVLDDGVSQLPTDVRAGHHLSDDRCQVEVLNDSRHDRRFNVFCLESIGSVRIHKPPLRLATSSVFQIWLIGPNSNSPPSEAIPAFG